MSCRLLAAVIESMHNRRAGVFHPALQLMSCLSFVRGEGHTLWLEGSHPFCEVLSLSATGGPPFATIGKEEGVPRRNNTPRRKRCLEVRDPSAGKVDEGLALGHLRRCPRCPSEILP